MPGFFRETAAAAKPEFRASWHWSLGALFTLNWYPLSTMMWEGGRTVIIFKVFELEIVEPCYESFYVRTICGLFSKIRNLLHIFFREVFLISKSLFFKTNKVTSSKRVFWRRWLKYYKFQFRNSSSGWKNSWSNVLSFSFLER